MSASRAYRTAFSLPLAVMIVVMSPAAGALANAKLRFVNARGGSDPVRLEVSAGGQRTPVGGITAFGQAGAAVSVPSGETKLTLVGGSGSGVSVAKSTRLENGASYTVVALPRGSKGFALRSLRDGKATGGRAKVRIFHAAPELGSPDIRLGKRTIAQGVRFRSATGFTTLDPGSYKLSVARPNGGRAVFSSSVNLAAGTATTVVVAGSGGSPTQLIEVNDGTVEPSGAPHTGLGGLASGGGEPWLLALLAALVAGTLGGAGQLARARRSRQ